MFDFVFFFPRGEAKYLSSFVAKRYLIQQNSPTRTLPTDLTCYALHRPEQSHPGITETRLLSHHLVRPMQHQPTLIVRFFSCLFDSMRFLRSSYFLRAVGVMRFSFAASASCRCACASFSFVRTRDALEIVRQCHLPLASATMQEQ